MIAKIFGLALLTSAAFFCHSAGAQISASADDIAEMYQGSRATATITLHNDSNSEIAINSVAPIRAGDRVLDAPTRLAPKSDSYAKVEIFSERDSGDSGHLFKILTSDPKIRANAQVRAFVLSVLDESQPEANLGVVDLQSTRQARQVDLNSSDEPDLHVTGIVETPDFAEASVAPSGKAVLVNVRSGAAWGLHQGMLRVSLSSKRQPEAWIRVSADVRGDVVPSQNPVEVGVGPFNPDRTFEVDLRDRSGKKLTTGQITLTDGLKGSAKAQSCGKEAPDCVRIALRLAPDQPLGLLNGKMHVALPALQRNLAIDVHGVLLDKNAKIIPLDGQLNGSDNPASPASRQAAAVDLRNAIKSAVQPAAGSAEPPPGRGPLLKWQTANESTVHGYLVYRGSDPNGPFARVNPAIIAANVDGGPGIATSYQYRDTSAAAGETYWYYISIVYRDGRKQQLTGPQKVVAK